MDHTDNTPLGQRLAVLLPAGVQHTLFVTGINTDAGKSYCTAYLANLLGEYGYNVITQKFIQTGNADMSEDIELHRRLTGQPLLTCDIDHTTAPIIFSYPCSPQLAARIDNKEIDLSAIDAATEALHSRYGYDTVLIEGAGGLMVPITDTVFTIDYIASRRLPAALTVHSGLGSINHIILSIEALLSRNIPLPILLYNHHFDTDALIAADTRDFLARYLRRHSPTTLIIDVPSI